jgi:FtsP/CotA-like multicopper oxidase with cupredoxin domain
MQACGVVGVLGCAACSESVRLSDVPAAGWVDPPEPLQAALPGMARQRGQVSAKLTVDFADLRLGQDAVRLRTYNGAIVGPTLRARAGDRITIDLVNQLRAEPDPPQHPPHGLNITNLHTHGLHVSPLDGDNVFLEIGDGAKDGERMSLVYNIPDDHPPGTFWYHPHKHGSVSVQLASGMAGALIIEGDIDEVPEIAAAQDRIFVFQQIPYNQQGTVGWDDVIAKFTRVTTINGQVKPQVTMRPGEVQRWRFIHAGIKEKLPIALTGHALNVIAYDGVTTGRVDSPETIELYPGYRADVLVKASDTPGTYQLTHRGGSDGLLGAEQPQALAEVVIAGEPMNMDLPDESDLKGLAPYEDLRAASLYRDPVQIKFNVRANKYSICDKVFDMSSAVEPLELKLGAVDEIVLSTLNRVPGPPHHPFHIHVNPFQQIKVGGTDLEHPIWRDTVIVEKDQPVTIRMRPLKFVGDSVIHCHILDHEDRGMMMKFRIVDGDPRPPAC